MPQLRRRSFSAAPLVSSGPSRSRLPAGTRASRKSRGEGYAHAPAGSRCLLLRRLRRRSLRIETVCDSSAAPLVNPGPSRSRLPAGTRDSRKTRAKEYAHALVPTVYQGSFRRACGHMGKSRRLLARLFQAGVGIRVVCGFPRTRHFHQAKPYSFNPPSRRCPRVFYPQIPVKTRKFELQIHRAGYGTTVVLVALCQRVADVGGGC